MKSKINILYIASFNGNMGDNFSHNGLYQIMEQMGVDAELCYHNLEMREFYHSWGNRRFENQAFVEQCNANDLVMIGGGGYFEAKWDYSRTGTSFDISLDTFRLIKTPVFFNSIGIDVADTGSQEARERFQRFFNYLCKSDQYLINVRNDGSYGCLKKLIKPEQMKQVNAVFDNAFFMNTDQKNCDCFLDCASSSYRLIGINVCKDRFMEGCDMHSFRYDAYVKEMGTLMNRLLEEHKEYAVVFFPHIFSDLEAISDVLRQIHDDIRRIRIFTAPLLTGQGSEKEIIHMYGLCDFILAMRFHANVIGMVQNIPTIGLCCHARIRNLYQEMGVPERLVNVNESFSEELYIRIEQELQGKTGHPDFLPVIRQKKTKTIEVMKAWLVRQGLCENMLY